MNDYLVRGMTLDGFAKVTAIRSTELVREGARIHHTSPNATAAFGRLLTAGSMMGCTQKGQDESLTLQVRGGGPIGTITVVSDAEGNVRGCMTEPNVPLVEKYPGKLDVGATVGRSGTLTVIRDLRLKEPYVGSVPLVSGELGDDITAYYAYSEQTPTVCALGVLVDRDYSVKVAGGYLLQLLPGAPEETIAALEDGVARSGAVTTMLTQGLTPEDILGQVCGSLGVQLMQTAPVSYRCYCTRERVERMLISLGVDELTEIAQEGKDTSIACQFCDKTYVFTPDDIRAIVRGL